MKERKKGRKKAIYGETKGIRKREKSGEKNIKKKRKERKCAEGIGIKISSVRFIRNSKYGAHSKIG